MRAKLLAAVAASGLIALGTASTAGAAVTLGQLSPLSPADTTCNGGPFDTVQPTVTSGNGYVVPSTGGVTSWTVTSWSHNASIDTGQSLTMKFWRPLGGTTYMAVGHDGPRSPTPSTVNTYSGLSIPVKSGDVLGISPSGPISADNGCGFNVTGDQWQFRLGNLADGQSDPFTSVRPNNRLNVTAVIDPTNTFALGTISRNRNKGTATITVTNLSNPGQLTASGKGVKASAAAISKAVTAGTAKLTIRAKGKKKAALNDVGKVKVKPKITFTPTGGTASTQSLKLKLKKNL